MDRITPNEWEKNKHTKVTGLVKREMAIETNEWKREWF